MHCRVRSSSDVKGVRLGPDEGMGGWMARGLDEQTGGQPVAPLINPAPHSLTQ